VEFEKRKEGEKLYIQDIQNFKSILAGKTKYGDRVEFKHNGDHYVIRKHPNSGIMEISYRWEVDGWIPFKKLNIRDHHEHIEALLSNIDVIINKLIDYNQKISDKAEHLKTILGESPVRKHFCP
jgi:hypothetical protein